MRISDWSSDVCSSDLLVDCHTHAVFAGDRAGEFEQRLQGADYEQIARAGGGIVSTVRHTRAASEDELLAQSLPRARALLADGVTTLEVKSGYGLDFDNERSEEPTPELPSLMRISYAVVRLKKKNQQ